MSKKAIFILDNYVASAREEYVMEGIGAMLWAVRQGKVAVWHSDPWNLIKRYQYKQWLKEKIRVWAMQQSDTVLVEYLLGTPNASGKILSQQEVLEAYQLQQYGWVKECLTDSYRKIQWLYQRPATSCQRYLSYVIGNTCPKK